MKRRTLKTLKPGQGLTLACLKETLGGDPEPPMSTDACPVYTEACPIKVSGVRPAGCLPV